MTTRLLYVDDEEDIREVALMALELEPGFEVCACSSGEEALAAAPDWSPALIMLDVMMPRMDGPTTLTKMREMPELASTPVVFVTARTQAAERERLLELGAAGVIAKPFDPMTLAANVRAFL